MQNKVLEMLQEYTGETIGDIGLEEDILKNREEYRRTVSYGIRNCCSGNYGAREMVKKIIYSVLMQESLLEGKQVQRLIPFDEPEKMSAWQQMETMIYYYNKDADNQGFELLCNQFGWNHGGITVSEQKVKEAYNLLAPVLTMEDKRKILVQLLFACTMGLGIVDTLNYQTGYIEEIQIGMSGRIERQYNYKTAFSGYAEEIYSRDGIHIMAQGCTIWLKALSFETEEELQRVLRNLIKESNAGELTQNNPMLVVDTADGRRISVSRPPMTDTWVGLIRKFDSVKEVSLERLYQNERNKELLPNLLRQLIRSGRNIAITGEMASGKTTLFRACLAETKPDRNLRVIEVDSFELNVRGFLPQSNSITMRVTEQTPAEEVLAFARKTTGQIFAIGEINSASVAVMAMDLSKIASQLFFSAHYVTTEHMIVDFVNAKLCVGGYSEELLAELDVVRSLGFDIHLRAKQGRRYVEYINEVIPAEKQNKNGKTYEIRPIYRFDEEKEKGVLLNTPGKVSYERAKQLLEKEEYLEFLRFFEK